MQNLWKCNKMTETGNLETIYADKTAWVFFEGEYEETIGVYCRCPKCARYITRGKLLMDGFGEITLEGWKCKQHGKVEPYFDRDC